MGIIKNLTFDGINTSDYGIGITGAGVYNAPERDVEMIEIPGRNGEFALDKKRFRNINVEYPAGGFDDSQPDFADKMSDLRNALASRIGYKRLEDEYNPDEYRMAIFKDGLAVDPAHYSTAGEFPIIFNCKPQRFLKSGETEVVVSSGGSITNPTLFDAQPVIRAEGEGSLTVNGYEIKIEANTPIGNVTLATMSYDDLEITKYIPANILNPGDDMTVANYIVNFILYPTEELNQTVASYTKQTSGYAGGTITDGINEEGAVEGSISYGAEAFTFGTSRNISKTVTYSCTTASGKHVTFVLTITFRYNGSRTFSFKVDIDSDQYDAPLLPASWQSTQSGAITGYSTILEGGTTIIDCEAGEAYKYDSGELIPLNDRVFIGADLPVLSPGENTLIYDNTITEVGITPRWWKI